MPNINIKTMTRIAAVQGLYCYQILGANLTLEDLIEFINLYYKDSYALGDLELEGSKISIKLQVNYLHTLLSNTINYINDIDSIITCYLSNDWRIQNLQLVLLSILRIGICEVKFCAAIPRKVIISEFTNIASALLSNAEVGFVNSLLDKASINIRQVLSAK